MAVGGGRVLTVHKIPLLLNLVSGGLVVFENSLFSENFRTYRPRTEVGLKLWSLAIEMLATP